MGKSRQKRRADERQRQAMAERNASGKRGVDMEPDQATAQAIREMTSQIGKLCGSVEALQEGQRGLKADLRADVAGLHAKIESYSTVSVASVENVYRNGTVFCLSHAQQEARLREVENWKIVHDTETKEAAREAGGAAGGRRGGLYGAIILIVGFILDYFFTK